jgi:selenocysteine lyase/cysteine desulfurase
MRAALDGPDVRALALSAVQFATGYRADLKRLGAACKERNILFCVDAIQALGAVELHPRDAHVDVLAAGGQKWLCSAWGSGFTYIARGLQARFEPPMASWLGVKGGGRLEDMLQYRMEWVDGARRFELATLGLQDYLVLARSVEVLLEMGVDQVTRHIHQLHGPVIDWAAARKDVRVVTPRDPDRKAGILSVTLPGVERAFEELRQADITCALREGTLRLAPHYYNELEEMERVVRILDGASPMLRHRVRLASSAVSLRSARRPALKLTPSALVTRPASFLPRADGQRPPGPRAPDPTDPGGTTIQLPVLRRRGSTLGFAAMSSSSPTPYRLAMTSNDSPGAT